MAVERPDWAPCRTQYLRLELCYLDKIRQRKLALGIDIEKEETVGEDAEGESGKKKKIAAGEDEEEDEDDDEEEEEEEDEGEDEDEDEDDELPPESPFMAPPTTSPLYPLPTIKSREPRKTPPIKTPPGGNEVGKGANRQREIVCQRPWRVIWGPRVWVVVGEAWVLLGRLEAKGGRWGETTSEVGCCEGGEGGTTDGQAEEATVVVCRGDGGAWPVDTRTWCIRGPSLVFYRRGWGGEGERELVGCACGVRGKAAGARGSRQRG